MRYILLSADTRPNLYEAPDDVAERLDQYADEFLDTIHNAKASFWVSVADASGGRYDRLSYTEQDFVNWLNSRGVTRNQQVVQAELLSREEREIMMETARKERYLPINQQKYPWFNF